ncbi:vesicle transport protein SFT2A isoform X1 [Microplitis demolitor]|uniref:vesicle transport protein SFT2A isoform X1 n=1 Tax=Microplitis demolitor TaxID=69319 RepID=UPI0004CDACBE|nr:vesicle transport protein SFT2A isoform X1 [Microplitis demolitor]XP_014298738.1 vesicle transport protein SFT2A isoform X1 [Microplitis demolitor]
MDKLRRALSGHDQCDEESGIMTQHESDFLISDGTTLSWSTRIKGFAICFIIGILLSFLGSFALFLHKGLTVFAVFYTLGNIVSLMSTCFLMGPVNQLKKMFASTRIIATLIVILALIMTLYAAIKLDKPGLALLFIIIQSLAMTWYSLSYIPYARDAVKKTVESCIT